MTPMKLCTDCRHSLRSDSPLDDGRLKCGKDDIRSPIDGQLFSCEEVRLIGVVGYTNSTVMEGIRCCAPIGDWWEVK